MIKPMTREQWNRNFCTPPENPNAPPVRIIMAAGKWKVPLGQRPALAPVPVEHKPENPSARIRSYER